MKTRVCFLAVLCFAGIATVSNAEVINIDFNVTWWGTTYSGTAVAPDAGTIWNSKIFMATLEDGETPDPAGYTKLVNSNGDLTGAGINLPSTLGYANIDYLSGHSAVDLMGDFQYVDSGVANTVTINGLIGTSYDLYLYGTGGDGQYTTFTVNGASQETSQQLVETTDFVIGEDYVVFSSVAPTDDKLAITFTNGTDATYGIFNGLQIVGDFAAVPEPTTVALLSLGSLLIRRIK